MANKKDQTDYSKLPISAQSLTLICENKKTKQFSTYIKLISDQVPQAQDAVSEVLTTILVKKKFSNPTGYVSALLLYKNVLVSAQMDYYQSQDLFPSQIHQSVAKICEYKGSQNLTTRGKTYFTQIFKSKQSQETERLGTTAVALALQIIQNLSMWYPIDFFQQNKSSRFKIAYQKLIKMNVTFPQKGTFIVMKKQDQTNFRNNFDQFIRSNNTQKQTQEKNQSNVINNIPSNRDKKQQSNKKSDFQKLKQAVNSSQKNVVQNTKSGQSNKNNANFVPLIPLQNDLQSKIQKPTKQQQKVSFILQPKQQKPKQANSQIPQLKEKSKIVEKSKKQIPNNQIKKQNQIVKQQQNVHSKINQRTTSSQKQKQKIQKQIKQKLQTKNEIDKNINSKTNNKKQEANPQINDTTLNTTHHLHKKQETFQPVNRIQKNTSNNLKQNHENVNFILTPEKNKGNLQNQGVSQKHQQNSVFENKGVQNSAKNHKRIFKIQRKNIQQNSNIKQDLQQNQIGKQKTPNKNHNKQSQKQNIQMQFYNNSPNLNQKKGKSLPKTQKRSGANFFQPKNNQSFIQNNFSVETGLYSAKKDSLNQTLSHYRLQKKTIRDPFNQTRRNATLLSFIEKLRLDKVIVPFLPAYFEPTTLQMNALRRASMNIWSHFQSAQTFFNNKIIQARLIKSSKNIYILSILNLTAQNLKISTVDLKQGKFTSRIKILNSISPQQQHQLLPNSYLDIRFGFNIKDFNFRFLPFFIMINSKILPLTLPITLLDQCQIKKQIDLQSIQEQLALYGKIMKSTPFSMNQKDLPKFFGHNNIETVQSARKNVFQSKLIGQCSITMDRLDPLQKPNQVGVYITSVDKHTNIYELNVVFNKKYSDNQDFAKVIIQLLVFLICK